VTTLEHVLWIGGASGAGKTTLATRLARRHGLRWYSADARTWDHRDAAIRGGHEGAIRWEGLSPEERHAIALEEPGELVRLNLDLDRGPMIVDDLRSLPAAPLVVADGSTVLPELVDQGHARRDRSVWLIPTFEAHRSFHEEHGMAHLVDYRWHVIREVERQTDEYGVNVVHVDGSFGPDDVLAAVEALLAEAIADGPCATTPEERRGLLCWANGELVRQARAYLARPWSTGDEATFSRPFRCECDDPECEEVVPLPVAEYAPGITAHT
jgi:hypothetical protein